MIGKDSGENQSPSAESDHSSQADRQAARPDRKTTFPIVGLGASAGGLEALEEFFRRMPIDNGMAFVVVMHQAHEHVSLLPELLGACTKMKVMLIQNRAKVLPNVVYISPPGKNVDLLNGVFHLTDLPHGHLPPLPIDYFFRSLASERLELAVAVVLSGTGTDGTVGLAAVKGESGMVMVQSTESAKFSGMPQHAIEAGNADYVLAPDEMPAQLMAYAQGPFLQATSKLYEPPVPVQQSLPEILLKLRHRCGHDFSSYKISTICRRIERRMNVHQIKDPATYLKYLDEHDAESRMLFRELLIGVTSFFRDPWAFQALSKHAISPLLRESASDAPIRIWVPACSTGEEAYSIAILLRECMDQLKVHRNVQIFATDLDDHAIQRARVGLFPAGIGVDVSARRLRHFFTKTDNKFQIRREIRDWLIFASQNVVHDPPFTKLDLISCRNLLIYMQSSLQKKLLDLFHYSLRPGGSLFLGTSETISESDDLFHPIDGKAKIFRRTDSAHRVNRRVQFPVIGTRRRHRIAEPPPQNEFMTANIRDTIARVLANEFAPPTVVVRRNGEIVHVHGRTGTFLELAQGGPSQNILTMAREGIELELASALHEADGQEDPVVRYNIPVRSNGEKVLVNLTVQKISNPKSLRGLLRISFQTVADLTLTKTENPRGEANSAAASKQSRSHKRELEIKLRQTQESLQHTMEEMETSNEELQSTNEELQSTNEELQSTNEELETSTEELQSLNEELQTVNAEFQEKIHELSMANDDMSNLLNSTEIATIFLDSNLKIKRYTERATQIVSLIPSDLGRSLGDLSSSLKHDDLVSDANEVLKTLVPKECEVQTESGTWLLMRILPYRTAEDHIDGIVITFIDINEVKRYREQRAASELAESIVATVRQPLLVLDDTLQVRFANHAFYSKFHTTDKDTIGKLLYDLGDGQWNIPALRRLLEDILPKNTCFEDFEVSHDFLGIGFKRILLNARRIDYIAGWPSLILLAIEEVAEQAPT